MLKLRIVTQIFQFYPCSSLSTYIDTKITLTRFLLSHSLFHRGINAQHFSLNLIFFRDISFLLFFFSFFLFFIRLFPPLCLRFFSQFVYKFFEAFTVSHPDIVIITKNPKVVQDPEGRCIKYKFFWTGIIIVLLYYNTMIILCLVD